MAGGDVKRRVCFICYDFSLKRGGQRVAINVANSLTKIGYKVDLISEFSEEDKLAYTIADDVTIYTIIPGKGRLRNNIGKLVKKSNKIVNEQKYECIISVGYSSNLLCVILSRRNNIPYWHWEHYSLNNEFDATDFISKLFRYVGAHSANKFVVLTERSKDEFITKYKIEQDKICVIPNALPREAFSKGSYNSNSKIIVSVGKVEKIKGYDRLLEVAKLVKPYALGWQWHIYGGRDDEYYIKLKEMMCKNDLEGFIFFDGETSEIYEKYRKASIFVLTSLSECLPMALLEAKASRLPIVSFDINTGPREIIRDGINGFLIEDGNIGQMSLSLIKLISNDELRVRFSNNSELDIEHFSEEAVNQKWVEQLENL